jgi:hypothetical protein
VWTGEAIRDQFPTAHQAVTRAAPTEPELIRKLTSLIEGEDGAGGLMDELEHLPGVQRHGISKVLAADLKSSLADLAERLGYLIRAHDGQFATEEPTSQSAASELDDELTDDGDDLALEVAS